MVYFSQETKQKWSASTSQQDVSAEEGEIDGGALWLPGNTVLELQMLPMVSLILQAIAFLVLALLRWHLIHSLYMASLIMRKTTCLPLCVSVFLSMSVTYSNLSWMLP